MGLSLKRAIVVFFKDTRGSLSFKTFERDFGRKEDESEVKLHGGEDYTIFVQELLDKGISGRNVVIIEPQDHAGKATAFIVEE